MHTRTTSTAQAQDHDVRRPRSRAIPVTIGLAVVVLTGHLGYHAWAVRANIDVIEWVPNYAGGFVAFGWTNRQPGIVMLSEMDREAVEIRTTGDVLRTHTRLHVATPAAQWSTKLYEPHVLLVTRSGEIQALPVPWSRAVFQELSDAVDCEQDAVAPAAVVSKAGGLRKTRCGAGLADLADFIQAWKRPDVPAEMRTFLQRHIGGHV